MGLVRKLKLTHSQVVAVAATLPSVVLLSAPTMPTVFRYILTHTAVSGYVVALASTRSLSKFTTGLFGKSKQGKLSPFCTLVFLPFQAAIRAKLWYKRHVGSEPLYSHIADRWYVGGWPKASDIQLLEGKEPQSAAVLDCTCELPRKTDRPYLCIATWDTHAPTVEGFERGVKFALEKRDEGRSVLVHCAHGHGRSVAMLCAILIAEGKVQSVDEAESFIKKKRPRARLNRNQKENLIKWFDQRHKKD
mmetsp:Transcript_4023/g.11534  ORF Transcript_4023/g.11534 Transcript_4023/m.11534 type:complete len:248 (-) Transcript_4023:85-828(-)